MAAATAAWQATLPAALAERAMSLLHNGIAPLDEVCEAPWRRELAVPAPGHAPA